MSPDTISKYVYEDSMARFERHIKRQWITILILIAALILTNAGWIYYEAQFEDVSTEVSQEVNADKGGNAYLFGEKAGAVYYGTSKADD